MVGIEIDDRFINSKYIDLKHQGDFNDNFTAAVHEALTKNDSRPIYVVNTHNALGQQHRTIYFFDDTLSRFGSCPSPETLDKLLRETSFVGSATIATGDINQYSGDQIIWKQRYEKPQEVAHEDDR